MKTSKLYKTLIFLIRPIFKLVYRLEVSGTENIPQSGRAIICPNHTSNADPILLAIALRRQVFFMAKKELFANKVASKFFRALGAFPVNRGAGDTSALEQAKNVLREGELLGIFIEGARSITGEFLRPKTGTSMIAYETDSEVIPVYIRCADGGRVSPLKKNILVIGKPLSLKELNLTESSGKAFRDASRTIMENIKKLGENQTTESTTT